MLHAMSICARAAKPAARRPLVPVAAVAVTEKTSRANSATLQALTAAALLLPGMHTALAQTPPSLSVQATRFEEGERHTAVPTGGAPLQAWTLDLHAVQPLNDSLHVALDYTQDSWSGATPVATAPLAFGGNRPRRISSGGSTVISGASPLLNGTLLLDGNLTPLALNAKGVLRADTGNELIMSSASPELRQQLNAAFVHTATSRRFQLDLGLSHEDDYRSRHVGARTAFDFNNKQTTLALGAGYTSSDISANLSGGWLPYLTTTLWHEHLRRNGSEVLLEGSNRERSLDVGLTQIINRSALLDFGISIRQVDGLLENPYRSVTTIFIDPTALGAPATTLQGDVRALLEQRPDSRRIDAVSARYVQHVASFDAALHINYDYSHDDWGVNSHAVEFQWLQPLGAWLVTPRLRWYSQRAAWFHQDYVVSKQRYRGFTRDEQGREIWLSAHDKQRYTRTQDGRYLDASGIERDAALLDLQPVFSLFSASLLPDQYSSDPRLGGYGVVSTGLSVQRHFDNGLTLEAGFDHYRRASSLQFNGAGDTPYADFSYTAASLALTLDLQTVARRQRQAAHVHSHGAALPAGLMLSHDPGVAGSWSTGYRIQQQDLMTMHMLHVAWQPNAQWTLMLMPQFMTMDGDHVHTTGGKAVPSSFGDTVVAALWHHPAGAGEWQLTAGLGIPASGYGAADVLPAVQYRTSFNRWNAGARISGSRQLESQHSADSDPAHSIEASLWIGTALNAHVSGTLRVTHSDSHYLPGGNSKRSGVGAGLAYATGTASLALEWLVPINESGNTPPHTSGHSLFASWHLPF